MDRKTQKPRLAESGLFDFLANASCGQLKSSEKFLPRRCNQCLRECMPVGTNDHRRLLHFLAHETELPPLLEQQQ